MVAGPDPVLCDNRDDGGGVVCLIQAGEDGFRQHLDTS